MRTTFDQPACPTPSAEGNHEGTRGGADIPDGQKETAGTIPNQPTLTKITDETVPSVPDISDYPGSNRGWPADRK